MAARSAWAWEGAAGADDALRDPVEVYVVATNAFPGNTVVDVTNLENGRSVRVLVVSGLDAAGLLATLSRAAADSIGMGGDSLRRVRMTHPVGEIPFAHIRRGPLPSANDGVLVETEPGDDGAIDDRLAETEPEGHEARTVAELVPDVDRPPPPDESVLDPGMFIPPPATRVPPDAGVPSFHGARVVAGLDRNMWYVQIGAFGDRLSVADEIDRVGTRYPLLVHPISTADGPMYRVLIGPLNQGESAAALRRVRGELNAYAFVRQGEAIRTSPYAPVFLRGPN